MIKGLISPMRKDSRYILEKRRLRGEMRALIKFLKGCHTEEGQDLFSIIPEYRTRNNGLTLQGQILAEYQEILHNC